jgi:hypothetical protein
MNRYLHGLDVLGASTVNPASDYGATFGPLSPADLVNLNRKLTPAEQAAVDVYQSKQADAELAANGGGKLSQAVAVTTKGAVIKSLSTPTFWDELINRPWWQLVIGGVGVLAVGFGFYKLIKKPKLKKHVDYDDGKTPTDYISRMSMRKMRTADIVSKHSLAT